MSFCAICTGDAVGALHEVIDGKRVLVCKPCREETPRTGRYSFQGDRSKDPRQNTGSNGFTANRGFAPGCRQKGHGR